MDKGGSKIIRNDFLGASNKKPDGEWRREGPELSGPVSSLLLNEKAKGKLHRKDPELSEPISLLLLIMQ